MSSVGFPGVVFPFRLAGTGFCSFGEIFSSLISAVVLMTFFFATFPFGSVSSLFVRIVFVVMFFPTGSVTPGGSSRTFSTTSIPTTSSRISLDFGGPSSPVVTSRIGFKNVVVTIFRLTVPPLFSFPSD